MHAYQLQSIPPCTATNASSILERILERAFGMACSCSCEFFLSSFTVSKRRTFKVAFNFGNKENSAGEYGRWDSHRRQHVVTHESATSSCYCFLQTQLFSLLLSLIQSVRLLNSRSVNKLTVSISLIYIVLSVFHS